MNLIDLLLSLQIPVWLVLVLALAGMLAMTYYKNRLDRRIKELEHRLEKESTNHEKDLEFVQERHKKRLEALDEVNAALMEFDHALDHLSRGDSSYADRLTEYFSTSRMLARKYESLLGEEFHQAVKDNTDLGIGILQATFTLRREGYDRLQGSDLPSAGLEALRSIIGKTVPVTDAEQLVQGLDDQVRSRHEKSIFDCCELSERFNRLDYHMAQLHLQKLKHDLLRTLPRPLP